MLPFCAVLLLLVGGEGTTAAADITYECFPNNTVLVSVPVQMNWVIANNTVRLCNTTLGANRVTITGCDMDDDIFLVYTERANTQKQPILGGVDYHAYTIKCTDIPDTGFTRSFELTHLPTFTLRGNLTFTPNIDIDSEIRLTTTGIARHDLFVGSLYYWTIDIPADYYGVPRDCYALPGQFPADSVTRRINLIQDGCTLKTKLILSFDHTKTILVSSGAVRRYWTEIYAFKFIDRSYVSLYCKFEYCQSPTTCPMNCNNTVVGRRRRDLVQTPFDFSRIDRISGDLIQDLSEITDDMHTSGLSVAVRDADDDVNILFTLSGASMLYSNMAVMCCAITAWLVSLFSDA